MINFDSLGICDRCGSDAAYITEVNDHIKLYKCFGCGFVSNTIMVKDSEFLKEQLAMLPNLYKELMVEDESGKIWMPSMVNIPNQGMVFADGSSAENWKWGAVKATLMDEKEKEKFKSKGKDFTHKMDMKTLKHFNENEYMDALEYIGVFDNA